VNPKRVHVPTYIALQPDNWRARASRAMLGRPGKTTFDEWSTMAFDRHCYPADREVPLLFRGKERGPVERSVVLTARLRPPRSEVAVRVRSDK
jgi:hypothetical protein